VTVYSWTCLRLCIGLSSNEEVGDGLSDRPYTAKSGLQKTHIYTEHTMNFLAHYNEVEHFDWRSDEPVIPPVVFKTCSLDMIGMFR
jgi:hypothetical protein